MADETPRVTVSTHSDSFAQGDKPYVTATHTGSQKVAQIDLPLAGLSKSGKLFTYSTAGGTAKAPVSAIGTTTAAFALWNGNTVASQINLEVHEVAAFLVSGTAPLGSTFIAGLSPSAQASAVSAYASIVGPKSLNNSAARASSAIIGGAITLAAAPVWRQIGAVNVACAVGGGIVMDLKGSIIIPPQVACGFTVVSDSGTTPLWGWTFTYAEQYSVLQ